MRVYTGQSEPYWSSTRGCRRLSYLCELLQTGVVYVPLELDWRDFSVWVLYLVGTIVLILAQSSRYLSTGSVSTESTNKYALTYGRHRLHRTQSTSHHANNGTLLSMGVFTQHVSTIQRILLANLQLTVPHPHGARLDTNRHQMENSLQAFSQQGLQN